MTLGELKKRIADLEIDHPELTDDTRIEIKGYDEYGYDDDEEMQGIQFLHLKWANNIPPTLRIY